MARLSSSAKPMSQRAAQRGESRYVCDDAQLASEGAQSPAMRSTVSFPSFPKLPMLDCLANVTLTA